MKERGETEGRLITAGTEQVCTDCRTARAADKSSDFDGRHQESAFAVEAIEKCASNKVCQTTLQHQGTNDEQRDCQCDRY